MHCADATGDTVRDVAGAGGDATGDITTITDDITGDVVDGINQPEVREEAGRPLEVAAR